MNVRYSDMKSKTLRIVKELDDMLVQLDGALQRRESTLDSVRFGPDIKDSAKFARLERRAKDAILLLRDGVQ